jgi:hypothetical protein
MGLDNYAMRGPEEELTGDDIAAFEAEAPNLCGGIASSDQVSFEGKSYCILVSEITGEDLHEDFIPTDRVKAMYKALQDCDPGELDYCNRSSVDLETQVAELCKFFKVCAERNLGIASGW